MPTPTERPDRPIPIYYLDDDVEALREFELDMAPAVVNPVCGVSTAEALYERVSVEDPCIIFVDLVLPDVLGGGYEVISTLRQMGRAKATRSPVIAVIAVTAASREESVKEAAYQAGADVFLYKPIKPASAIEAIIKPGWFRVQFQR